MSTLIVAGTDLQADGSTVEAGTSFPNADKRAEAKLEEAAFGREVPDAYDPAPFTVVLHSADLADSTAVATWISSRTRLFVPDASIAWADADETPLTSYIKDAQPAECRNYGTHGTVTIEGTRYPGWELPPRYAVDESGCEIVGKPFNAEVTCSTSAPRSARRTVACR
jgi:hypothetical protein